MSKLILEIDFKGVVCLKCVTVFICTVMMMCFCCMNVSADDLSEISAKSAIVIDGETGDVLFEKNAYERRPMASTTKIMSVLLVLESGEDLDKQFVVDSEAIKVEGSSMGLQDGDNVTLRDLCCGMLLPSGNDAANAAAVRVAGSIGKFVQLMNKKAEQLELNDTHFVTPSGLDDDTDEHYSTAADMAKLAAEAMKNEDFRAICHLEKIELCYGNPPYDRWLINSNKLLKSCEGIVGVKTGFTDKARRCLVSACDRKNKELICVTLNAPDDWNDHSKLYDYCFDFVSKQKLPLDKSSFDVAVVGGVSDSVKCKVGHASAVLLNGRASKVKTKIYLPRFVYAPVKSGDKIGLALFYYNDVEIARTDITAVEDAMLAEPEKPDIFHYYLDKLKKIVCITAQCEPYINKEKIWKRFVYRK